MPGWFTRLQSFLVWLPRFLVRNFSFTSVLVRTLGYPGLVDPIFDFRQHPRKHSSIWYPNVTTSNFQKANFYLGCSWFLRKAFISNPIPRFQYLGFLAVEMPRNGYSWKLKILTKKTKTTQIWHKKWLEFRAFCNIREHFLHQKIRQIVLIFHFLKTMF